VISYCFFSVHFCLLLLVHSLCSCACVRSVAGAHYAPHISYWPRTVSRSEENVANFIHIMLLTLLRKQMTGTKSKGKIDTLSNPKRCHSAKRVPYPFSRVTCSKRQSNRFSKKSCKVYSILDCLNNSKVYNEEGRSQI
jgi:hypothetical protein